TIIQTQLDIALLRQKSGRKSRSLASIRGRWENKLQFQNLTFIQQCAEIKIFIFSHLTESCRLDFRPNRAEMGCEIEENEDFAPARTAPARTAPARTAPVRPPAPARIYRKRGRHMKHGVCFM
ncbi:MAG TPA: hypothetical protein DCS59_07095, partial [Eubacterium sp.]|nr:hypothetical protein [Eubacterium sp.]